MDKRKGIILAIVLFLLIGLGTFVFAGSNEDILDGNDVNILEGNGNKTDDTALAEKEDDDSSNASTPVRTPGSSSSTGQTTNGALTKAEEAVAKAEDSLSQEDIDAAKDLVEDLANSDDKTSLNDRIDAVQNLVDVTKLVEELENLVNTSENLDDMNESRDFRTENKIDEAIALLAESENKEALSETLKELAQKLDDTTAPLLSGVPSSTTNQPVTITVDDINEVAMLLGEEEVTIDDLKDIIEDGVYTLKVTDAAFNTTTATFTIDTEIPDLGLKSGTHSTEAINITVDDATFDYAIVYNQDKGEEERIETSEFSLVDEATYKIVAYDEAGNKSETVYVAIDKTYPEIEGIDEDGIFNGKDEIKVTVSDKFLKEVTVNGEKHDLGKPKKNGEYFEVVITPSEDGTYEVIAKDRVGHPTTKTFKVDTKVENIVPVNILVVGDINEQSEFYAKVGDKIQVYFRVKEELKEIPKFYLVNNGVEIELDGAVKSGPNSADEYTYSVVHEILDDTLLTDGEVTLKIADIYDIAGNKADDVSKPSNSHVVYYDSTPVTINGIEHEATYTYDAVGVTPTSDDTDIDTVTLTKNGETVENYELGTAIVNSGEYALIVADKAGFVTSVEFTIEKATPTIEWTATEGVTINGLKATATYNGVGKEFTATLKKADKDENLVVKYTYQSGKAVNGLPTTADKFKVKASFAGDENNNAVEETIEFQIKKGTIKIEFTEEPTDYEYDGTAKEFKAIATLTNGNEEEINLVYYEGETKLDSAPTDAGTYTVVAARKGDHNHNDANKVIKEFTITQATPEIIWSGVGDVVYDSTTKKATTTYNGQPQAVKAVVKTVDGEEELEVSYYINGKLLDSAPVGRNPYDVKVSYAGDRNHIAIEDEIEFTIKKFNATFKFTEEPTNYVYDGTAKEFKAVAVLATEVKELTLTYFEGKTQLDGAPVDAGTYTVKATYKGDTNNNGFGTKSKTFTIVQATPEIIWSGVGDVVYDSTTKKATTTYNGQPQAVKAVVKTVNGEEELEVSYYINGKLHNGVPVGRNPYDVKASYAGDRNHIAVKDEIEFTIDKFNATFEFTEEPTNYVYDGTAKEFKAVAVLATEEKELTLTYFDGETQLDSAPVDAGTYTVKATYKGDKNHNGFGTKSKTFTITQATPVIEYDTNKVFAYDGTPKGIEFNVYDAQGNPITEPNRIVVTYKDAAGNVLNEIPTEIGKYSFELYVRADNQGNGNYTANGVYGHVYEIVKTVSTASELTDAVAYAKNGDIILLADGTYDVGTLHIDKAITLRGTSKNTKIVLDNTVWGQAGITVQANATLENFTVEMTQYKDVIKATYENITDIELDTFVIRNVDIIGGRVGVNIHGVKNALVDGVNISNVGLPLSAASGNVRVINSTLAQGSWYASMAINYLKNNPDYPTTARIELGYNNKIHGNLKVQYVEEGNIIDGNLNAWTASETTDAEGYTWYVKN